MAPNSHFPAFLWCSANPENVFYPANTQNHLLLIHNYSTHYTTQCSSNMGCKAREGKRLGCTQGGLSISEGIFCSHGPPSDEARCVHLELTQAEVMHVMLERQIGVVPILAKWNGLLQINIH